jgi:hypothetical protein
MAGILVFIALYLLGWMAGVIATPLMVFGLLVFGSVEVLSLLNLRAALRRPWDLRLDARGVTVAGKVTVPWEAIAEVQTRRLRPGWLFWGLGPRVVVFKGTASEDLPALPAVGSGRWSRSFGKKLYGSTMILMPRTTNTSIAEINEGVRRWSDAALT